MKYLTSYISVCSSDPKKGLELYNKCLKINPSKPPRYGVNLEILIPWVDWNNYTDILFPTIAELRSLEIMEYVWETDQKIEILPSIVIEKLYKTKMINVLGNLIGKDHSQDYTKIWFLDTIKPNKIFSYHLETSYTSLLIDIKDKIENGYIEKDVLYRRFINSNPKRFESLNNVIKNI